MSKRTKIWFLLSLVFCLSLLSSVYAISISAGGTVTENFTIGTSATATLPTDWKIDKNTTVRLVGSYASAVTATEQRAGNSMSSSAAGGMYNYAAGDPASATERAVGGISSSSAAKSVNVYVKLTNGGSAQIPSFTVSYNVEKYRMGSNAAGFSIQMYYSTNGTSWTSAGSDFLSSFAADASNNGYATAPGATTSVSSKTLNVALDASSDLYLAWNYSVTSGTTTSNAQALGIDDVSIVAGSAGANIAPSISNIFKNPSSGYTSSTAVSVTADVTDSDGTVEAVELRWGTSTGSYPNTINMSLDSDDTYAADSDIPAQADGTTVYFIIYAEDDDEDYSTSAEQSYTVNNPKINVTGSLNAFAAYVGEPSAYQSYTLSGNMLTGNIGVQAPAGFELCTTAAGTYTSSLDLASSYSGSIYVRLTGTSLGNYSGNIVHSSTGVANVNLAVSGSVTSVPAILLEENFNYTQGTNLKDNGWSAHSGANTYPPIVGSVGLTYTDYPSVSGLCGETTNNGEDVNKTFVMQSSGDIYCSFLINVKSTIEAGDYLFHLGPNPIGSDYKGRIFVGKDASNNVRFGLSKATTTVSWTGYNYALNTTYLVVMKYSIKSGTANDEVYAWINPNFSGPEPTPMMTAVASEADVVGGIGSVAIRQGNASVTALFDGIRVAKTWYHLFDQTVVPPSTPIVIGDVEVEANILLYYNDTLAITDPAIPFLPNAGNLVNPTVIVFTADSGTTDITLNVGAGTWYGLAYYGGGWQQGSPYPCNGPGTITFTNVPFGAKADVPVVISEGNDPTLPVELSSFTAVITAQNYVRINWTTQSESNLTGYYIYRNSVNNLQTAMKIESLIGATNTSNETNYAFIDQEVETGNTYYYWLQYNEVNGESDFHGPINVTLTQNPNNPTPVIPNVTELLNAYPNPFNPTTRIPYTLKNGGDVKLEIYNLKGQLIWNHSEKGKAAGYYWKDWDGKDMNGNTVSSGIYYYRMTSGKYTSSKKVVLMK